MPAPPTEGKDLAHVTNPTYLVCKVQIMWILWTCLLVPLQNSKSDVLGGNSLKTKPISASVASLFYVVPHEYDHIAFQ